MARTSAARGPWPLERVGKWIPGRAIGRRGFGWSEGIVRGRSRGTIERIALVASGRAERIILNGHGSVLGGRLIGERIIATIVHFSSRSYRRGRYGLDLTGTLPLHRGNGSLSAASVSEGAGNTGRGGAR